LSSSARIALGCLGAADAARSATREQGRKVLSLLVTGGQRGDSPQFIPVLADIRVPRLGAVYAEPDRCQ
jgi:hypothetical protein